MTTRTGMTDLISQFRSLVAESGTTIFSDERVQSILDNNRYDFYQDALVVNSQYVNGTVVYRWYNLPTHNYLEGTASGTAVVRIYNANGTTVTNYTSDFFNGEFTFDEDTRGSAYYMTGHAYNFNAAVSNGWKEKAAYYATNFDFKVEGREFKKSSIIKNALEMATFYNGLADPVQHNLERGDYRGK